MKNIVLLVLIFLFSIPGLYFGQNEKKSDIGLLLAKGKYKQIIETLTGKVKAGRKLTVDENYDLALAYNKFMDYNKAIHLLYNANKEAPERKDILFTLGRSYEAAGKTLAASYIYSEILNLDSTDVMAKMELAKTLLAQRSYHRAKKYFKDLTFFDSTNYYYFRQLGYCDYKLNKKEEALLNLRKAHILNKYDPLTALRLAKIYYDYKKFDDALNLLSQSLSLNSLNIPLTRLYAEILYKLKRYKSASVQFSQLLTLGDSTFSNFQRLGLSLYSTASVSDTSDTTDMKQAITMLKKSLRIEKQNPLSLLYLGLSYKSLNNFDEAIKYLNEALSSMIPDYIDNVYINLGASYEIVKKYRNAIKSYHSALDYNSESSVATLRLATLYDKLYKDKSVALAYYKKYLRSKNNKDKRLIDYANERIDKLTELIHFSK